MRNLMEKQLSWVALLMTTFYSLVAVCRGEKCGHEELARCARPLERINNNDFSFMMSKDALQERCPILEDGMRCIKRYTVKCMKGEQRDHFNSLYVDTNMAIMELCQDGPYQDEFLRHSPCMLKVTAEYEMCNRRYQRTTQEIERGNRTTESHGHFKSVCCAFQEYLDCVQHTVRRQCGDDTAKFTKDFHDRMSRSFLKSCQPYNTEECYVLNGSSNLRVIESLVPALLVLVLGRYFT